MKLIKYIIKNFLLKIKSLFSVYPEDTNKNYVSEGDLENIKEADPRSINASLSFVDKDNPIFSELKKIVKEVEINSLSDLVNMFTICYENRLKPNWSEITINELRNNNNKLSTAGKMNYILFNKALEAFFQNMGCEFSLSEKGKKDLEKATYWTITEMTAKWVNFLSSNTLPTAVGLIFKERNKEKWEVFDLKEKHLVLD